MSFGHHSHSRQATADSTTSCVYGWSHLLQAATDIPEDFLLQRPLVKLLHLRANS